MTDIAAQHTTAVTEGETLIAGMATAQTRQRRLLKRLARAKKRVAAPFLKRAAAPVIVYLAGVATVVAGSQLALHQMIALAVAGVAVQGLALFAYFSDDNDQAAVHRIEADLAANAAGFYRSTETLASKLSKNFA